jgi:RecG-like helicase
VLERTQSGLEVAEADLAHRGPGDLLAGVKQSGASALSSTTLHEMTRRPQVMEGGAGGGRGAWPARPPD